MKKQEFQLRIQEDTQGFYQQTFGGARSGAAYVLQAWPGLHRQTLAQIMARCGERETWRLLAALASTQENNLFPQENLIEHIAHEIFDAPAKAQAFCRLDGFSRFVLRIEALKKIPATLGIDRKMFGKTMCLVPVDDLTIDLAMALVRPAEHFRKYLQLVLESYPFFYRQALAEMKRDPAAGNKLERLSELVGQWPMAPSRQAGLRILTLARAETLSQDHCFDDIVDWLERLPVFSRSCLEISCALGLWAVDKKAIKPVTTNFNQKVLGDLSAAVGTTPSGAATFAVNALQALVSDALARNLFREQFSEHEVVRMRRLLCAHSDTSDGSEAGEELLSLMDQEIHLDRPRSADFGALRYKIGKMPRSERMLLEIFLRKDLPRAPMD